VRLLKTDGVPGREHPWQTTSGVLTCAGMPTSNGGGKKLLVGETPVIDHGKSKEKRSARGKQESVIHYKGLHESL